MEAQLLQDNQHYTIPKPDVLTTKILNDTATLQDFIDYDKTLSNYLINLGYVYQYTDREDLHKFYGFLCMLIQQFKDFLTFVADINCDYQYEPDTTYTQHHSDNIKKLYCMTENAGYIQPENSNLPLPEVKLFYNWLTEMNNMEEIFSHTRTFFSSYNHYLFDALRRLINI